MLARLCRVVSAVAAVLLTAVFLEPVALWADEPSRLPSWREQAVEQALQDPDVAVRREAVSWLSGYQASGVRLATELAKYLDRKEAQDIRIDAAAALGNMGAAGAAGVPQLAALLLDFDEKVNYAAVEALGKLAAAGVPVAGEVTALVAKTDSRGLQGVPQALNRLGAAVAPFAPQVAALLKDPKAEVRAAAAQALGSMGPAGAAFAPQVAALLKDSEQQVRDAAAQALGTMGAAAAPFAAQLAALLKDPNTNVRGAAVQALGKMGAAAAPYAPEVAGLLKDSDSYPRTGAARTLGQLGPAGAAFAPQVAALLNDSIDAVRAAAADALGQMGPAGAAFAPRVAALLQHPFAFVEKAAAQALAGMGPAGAAFAPQVAGLLTNSESQASDAAADALGRMYAAAARVAPQTAQVLKRASDDGREAAGYALGRMDPAFAPLLAALLKDPSGNVRALAASALSDMGVAVAALAPQAAAVLNDPDEHVRVWAVRALGAMGAAGSAFAPQVAALLKDDSSRVRYWAARALGAMGAPGAAFAAQVAALLPDEDGDVRSGAVLALGDMGAPGAPFVPQLAVRLEDAEADVRAAAAYAIVRLSGGTAFASKVADLWTRDPNKTVHQQAFAALDQLAQSAAVQVPLYPLLHASHQGPQAGEYFLGSYLFRNNSQQDLILIRWLGNRSAAGRPAVPKDRQGILEVLNAFNVAWEATPSFPDLRKDMAEQIPGLVRSPQAHLEPALVKTLEHRLRQAGFTDQAEAVLATQNNTGKNNWLYTGLRVVGLQVSFWAALIFLYPRWPWVQSFFFWNKWARRFLGLGYVGALITFVPWLRRRMFLPFRDSLLPPGILEQFSERSYFPDSEVILETHRPAGERPVPLKEALARIRGQVVLKGQSGLGKTLMLLRLASLSTEPVVYLRATECKGGVEAAIQRKLQGQLRDKSYLQSLIYAGGLKVLIDGINEAPPEARVAITHFVEEFFKGDFILATQPMGRESWEPPSTARVYSLQPLRPEQIEAFLLKQWESFAYAQAEGRESYLDQEKYKDAVSRYIAAIRKDVQESEDPRLLTLSNPMDATLAAELLARNQTPDTFRLVDQGYRVMAQHFKEERGRSFPLNTFSERVYEWRSSGEPYINPEGFEDEVAALAENRLMIRRTEVLARQSGETTVNRWFFRHDKVMEFFVLPAFMGDRKSARRYEDHVQEYEPFIGVYELLAVRLPDEEEKSFRERLIERTAETSSSELLIRYELARRFRPQARQGVAAHAEGAQQEHESEEQGVEDSGGVTEDSSQSAPEEGFFPALDDDAESESEAR